MCQLPHLRVINVTIRIALLQMLFKIKRADSRKKIMQFYLIMFHPLASHCSDKHVYIIYIKVSFVVIILYFKLFNKSRNIRATIYLNIKFFTSIFYNQIRLLHFIKSNLLSHQQRIKFLINNPQYLWQWLYCIIIYI